MENNVNARRTKELQGKAKEHVFFQKTKKQGNIKRKNMFFLKGIRKGMGTQTTKKSEGNMQERKEGKARDNKDKQKERKARKSKGKKGNARKNKETQQAKKNKEQQR